MFLTLLNASRSGWRPRSLKIPGHQWIGKHRRIRHVTKTMRRARRNFEERVASVESMIEFPYLTDEQADLPEKREQFIENQRRKLWQSRRLGFDVFGLGLGKPSVLDHLMVTDTRRYPSEKDDES